MSKVITCIILLFGLLFLSGCNDKNFLNESQIKMIAKEMNENFFEMEMEMKSLSKEFSEILSDDIPSEKNLDIEKKYIYSKYGLLYNPNYENSSSGVLTGYTRIDDKLEEKLFKSELIEEKFIDIYNSYAEIDQVYINDKNGLLRIFPGIDVLVNVLPKENLSAFNFYYLANEIHNKEKKAIWINRPYLDPAGRAWIISLIAPSYDENNELLGVLGFDMVINNLRKQYLKKNMFLVNSDGNLIAFDNSLTDIFEIITLEKSLYYEIVMKEKYLCNSYNLSKNKDIVIRELFNNIIENEGSYFKYEIDNKYIIVVEKIDVIDSYLVELILVD